VQRELSHARIYPRFYTCLLLSFRGLFELQSVFTYSLSSPTFFLITFSARAANFAGAAPAFAGGSVEFTADSRSRIELRFGFVFCEMLNVRRHFVPPVLQKEKF